jgi:hypothetical protein
MALKILSSAFDKRKTIRVNRGAEKLTFSPELTVAAGN